MKYKNFFKKPILVKIILIIIGISILSFLEYSFNFTGNNTSGLATLFINLETEKRFFEGEVTEDMTILDALSTAVSVGKIRLNFAINDFGGVSIMEIDGHTNGAGGKYFVFYLNSKKVSASDLNKKVVRDGDKIEIRNE